MYCYTELPEFCINRNSSPAQNLYLMSDAEDTLQDLDTSCAYIIGGILDQKRHKRLTYNKAKSQAGQTNLSSTQ